MTFFGPLTPLRVFRVVLFVKVITILASLLVALAVGDRTAQQHLSLAMFLAILMLILFGANWLEARLGVSALAVALGLAIPLQALEWGLTPLSHAQNLLTNFGAVEPFLFLVALVMLAAWQYGLIGAFLAVVASSSMHMLAVVWFDGLAQLNLLGLAARGFILAAAGLTPIWLQQPRLKSTEQRTPSPSTRPLGAEAAPVEKLSTDDLRRRLAQVLLNVDAHLEGMEDLLDDAGAPLRHALADARLDISQAQALVNLADSACACRLGLEEAVRHHVATFRERTGASVALHMQLMPDSLDPEQAAAAFHIVEESLARLAAQPDAHASISLKCSGSHVALSIYGHHNGAEAANRTSESRMKALRQRVEAVGGMICISHQAQNGTTVACVFPRRA